MERLIEVGDIHLESRVVGKGEPVVLVHGAIIADAFAPLLTESLLTDKYQLVSYHRRGYAGSTHPEQMLTMTEQAADCLAVMDAYDVGRAHVVGHSMGGAMAIQVALDAPERVQSLSLLEAAVTAVPSVHEFVAALAGPVGLYQAGQKAEAVDALERSLIGPDYRRVLDERIPGAFEQMVADADTVFMQELALLQQWQFTREDAARITVPTLVVLGGDSAGVWQGFKEGYDLLLDWLPQAEGFVLPGATHGVQMQEPHAMAEALVAFLARHPLLVPA